MYGGKLGTHGSYDALTGKARKTMLRPVGGNCTPSLVIT